MSDRDDIAAALSAIDGVNVTPYYRQATKPGEGFVWFASSTTGSSNKNYDQVVTYQVRIAIPQDVAGGEKWITDKTPAILGALEAVRLRVRNILPADISLESGTVNGVVFELSIPTLFE